MTGSRRTPLPPQGSPWLVTAVATGAILGGLALLMWWRLSAGVHDPAVVHGTVHPGDGDPGDSGDIRLADVVLRLVDEQGVPIPNTLVILDGEHGKHASEWTFRPAGGRTDPEGKVRFTSVPFGRWPVLLPDPKIALGKARLLAVGSDDTVPGSTIEYDVPVIRRRAVQGRVVNREAQPVPFVGLTIHVERDDSRVQQVATTNSQGRFEFYLAPGAHTAIRAELTTPQHRPSGDQPMSFEVGDHPIEIVVEQAPNPTLG